MFKFINCFIIFSTIFVLQIIPINSFSVEPEEILTNKKHEMRARKISKNIRCVICQNQSIDESNAPLAKDLRILIRNKIREGYSDKKIYKFLTDRYGDFVLLKPPFNYTTAFLWLFPIILFIFFFTFFFYHLKKFKK
tara:strand:+ start:106 stop:516 length:411 start_codon:yes stop_codon:yes gene_type:complete